MPRRIRRKKYSNQLQGYFHSVEELMNQLAQNGQVRDTDHVEIPWPSYQDNTDLDNKGRSRQ